MLLGVLVAATLTTCPVEQARYQLRGQPGVQARFYAVPRSKDWPGGLALRVRIDPAGSAYWFLPWQGGTDGRTNLAWVRERVTSATTPAARRDFEILATDRDYTIDASVPMAGDVAPAHFLIPDLREIAGYSEAPKASVDRAFFDLTACERRGAPAATPEIEFPAVP